MRATVRELARLGPALVDLAAPLAPYGHIWAWLGRAAGKLWRKQAPPESLRRYLERRATTDDFRQHLGKLGAEVRKETGQPLVFIIDELDRCRPTFAIELLERVKHIFDVPNIVFVFGINRSELVKSLESVYGEIDAGTYLRRFFDMEFVLPDADPTRFCTHLVRRSGLDVFFSALLPDPSWDFDDDGGALAPVVLARMGLSLRDMDYCLRLFGLAARDTGANDRIFPELFILLVATKIRNPDLYRRFVEGNAKGADLIDNLNGARTAIPLRATDAPRTGRILTRVEAAAYHADDPEAARAQLLHVNSRAGPLREPLHISSETSRLDPESAQDKQRLDNLLRLMSTAAGPLSVSGLWPGTSFPAAPYRSSTPASWGASRATLAVLLSAREAGAVDGRRRRS